MEVEEDGWVPPVIEIHGQRARHIDPIPGVRWYRRTALPHWSADLACHVCKIDNLLALRAKSVKNIGVKIRIANEQVPVVRMANS
jgi:hypothetical protein